MLTEEQLFCLEGCRSYEQYVQMRTAFEAGVPETESCIFCQLDRTVNEVLWESSLVCAWRVPKKYGRPELRYHGLVVPKRHVRFVAELSDEAVLHVHHAMQYLSRCFNYQGGLMHAREGDMRLNAGTVPHLHYNIFEPDYKFIEAQAKAAIARDDDEYFEVRVPVYKDPRDREENQKRAAEFAARYRDTHLKGLT